MINPKESDIGRTVIFKSVHGVGAEESGIIRSYNKDFVFVQYNGDWSSKATRRCDLHWPQEKTREKTGLWNWENGQT